MQEEGDQVPTDEPSTWVKILQCSANQALEKAIATLAGPAGSVVTEGFHILNFPLSSHQLLEAPEAGSRVRIFLTDAATDGSQPNALEYNADYDFDSAGGYSELNFLVRAAAAGSKSQYLPKVYKELYGCEE